MQKCFNYNSTKAIIFARIYSLGQVKNAIIGFYADNLANVETSLKT